MNYTDYRSTATIKNRALAERIKKSFFHYKTVRIGCKRNYATKKVTEYEEQIVLSKNGLKSFSIDTKNWADIALPRA